MDVMDIYELGPFRLDTLNGVLLHGSEPVALGQRAVALLRALIEKPGALVSKDVLIEAAWPGQAIEDSNLPVQIAALRRTLGKARGGDRWIETMPRRGYRFVGPVVATEEGSFTAAPQVAASRDAIPIWHGEAERRQITALSCELVGVGAGAAGTSLEDLRETIRDFERGVAETATRHAGVVHRHLGNNSLVLFGYPEAHEHDAEQAIRTGLELCAATRCRVGIATGLVIIGGPVRGDALGDREIVGGVPNLATRMLASAEPDTVAIDRVTRRLIGNLFDCRDLGELDTNSDIGPIRRWQVLRESIVASRFEALRGSKLTQLVGREEEIDLLLRWWARAKAGAGQVILVSGEAGIGKSRIAAAFEERVQGEPHFHLRYFCSPYHQDSALFPIIDQLGRAAGFARDDPPASKLEKLEVLLARAGPPDDDVAFLADLMSLPASERHPLPNLSPQRKKERTLAALIHQLEGLAHEKPVVTVFEDAHWLDPTSRELLDLTVERVSRLPVLLIVTFRPEFQPPWAAQPRVSTLALNRLDHRDRTALIAQIAGSKTLPDEVVFQIAERTDGVPLFVEELTKNVLESGWLSEENDRYVLERPLPPLAIPITLHASLLARLDRLASARHVVQVGAAIGRQFSYPVLHAVGRLPEDELHAALAQLVSSELVFQRGTPPDAIYTFKHALVQDAAHGSLLRSVRQQLHARIAEALEIDSPEIIESQPELLAQHYAEAGLVDESVTYWGKAGHRSTARSAMTEAAVQFQRALDQISALPATPARRREQIKLQVALITPLIPLKGHAAPETKAAAERARLLIEQVEALGEPLEDPLLLFSVRYAFWVANYVAFSGEVIRDLATEFLTLAEKQGATVPLMIGHRLMAISLASTGEIARGRTHYDQALALYEPAEHRPLAMRFGQDAQVTVLCHRSWALFCLGYPDAALADAENAIRYAREIGHAATLMHALAYASFIQIQSGNYPTANALVDELVGLTDEKGALFWKATAITHQGWLFARTGKAWDAVYTITAGINAWRLTGARVWVPLYLSHLANAYADIGNFEDAWRCIREATTAVETTKEKLWEAEIYRTAGEIALLSPEPNAEEAEANFARALRVARTQHAKSWELRAAMGMARLWGAVSKRCEARGVLASVYGWFTEGFDTRDLKEAKALLDVLQHEVED